MLSALALSPYVDRVDVLERDPPDEGRRRLPQKDHLHTLLQAGLVAVRDLIPDFDARAARAGAVPLDWGAQSCWCTPYGRATRFASRTTTWACSRLLLERILRSRLRELDNVSILSGHAVSGVARSSDGKFELLGEADGRSFERAATVVIDASGRFGGRGDWLTTIGGQRKGERQVDAGLWYVTRRLRLQAPAEDSYRQWIVQMDPPALLRGGTLSPLENGEAVLTLAGLKPDPAPHDDDALLNFAQSLSDPAIADQLAVAEPLSPPRRFQRTENRWSDVSVPPGGYLVIGDALCALNPFYGQGMTVAAKQAVALRTFLNAEGLEKLIVDGNRVQKLFAAEAATSWLLTTGQDRALLSSVGAGRDVSATTPAGYFSRLMEAAITSADAHQTALDVIHLVRSVRDVVTRR